ncbi:MAG: cell division protein ZapA [Rhizobiales bacterium 65-9]|nr:cell division protein ZapA [Hyphomicrobiales bacterium]OJY32904.1 MAG: cell division protein ZapA [Rhizobiales bacterium 65-9]
MAQVAVNVAGKSYRIGCNDGEEAHLLALAETVDAKIAELRQTFGEIGDMRLHVMAALTFADETSEMRKRLDRLEAEIATLQQEGHARESQARSETEQLATALDAAAQRVETLTKKLK